MRLPRQIPFFVVLAGLLLGAPLCLAAQPAATHARHHTRKRTASAHTGSRRHATRHVSRRTSHHRTRRSHKVTGQRAMDSQRATEIQQALIQAHYLDGQPTGQWDQQSQAAMTKYQSDNGWQTKITPDSRALIKLGLGPKQDAGEYIPSSPALSNSRADDSKTALPAMPPVPLGTIATTEQASDTQN